MASLGGLLTGVKEATKNRIGELGQTISGAASPGGVIGGAADILKDQLFKEVPYSQNLFNEVGAFAGDVAANSNSSSGSAFPVSSEVQGMSSASRGEVLTNNENSAVEGYLKAILGAVQGLFVELKSLTNITGKVYGVSYSQLTAQRQANLFQQNLDEKLQFLSQDKDEEGNSGYLKNVGGLDKPAEPNTPTKKPGMFQQMFTALLGEDAFKALGGGIMKAFASPLSMLSKTLMGSLRLGMGALELAPLAIGAIAGYEGYETFKTAYPIYQKDHDKEKFIATMFEGIIEGTGNDVVKAVEGMTDALVKEIDSVDWSGLKDKIEEWVWAGIVGVAKGGVKVSQDFTHIASNKLRTSLGFSAIDYGDGVDHSVFSGGDDNGATLAKSQTAQSAPQLAPSDRNTEIARSIAQNQEQITDKENAQAGVPAGSGNSNFVNASQNTSNVNNVLPQNLSSQNPVSHGWFYHMLHNTNQ